MNKILLEPLIWWKYPRNFQNTLNLYFGNFLGFGCILFILDISVILDILRGFGRLRGLELFWLF